MLFSILTEHKIISLKICEWERLDVSWAVRCDIWFFSATILSAAHNICDLELMFLREQEGIYAQQTEEEEKKKPF